MINIAIDGPAGSGKSTIAKRLSQKLNILYLDTGAMYRACALKAVKCGLSCKDEAAVSTVVNGIDLKIRYINGEQHTFLDGEDVSFKIRENIMSEKASEISRHAVVRNKMVEMQRSIAAENDCVLDGRDICMYVLPNANHKYFIYASPEIRAKRRRIELLQRGQDVSEEKLLKEIKERDYADSHRSNSPLTKAPDAYEIDTSDLTVEQVVDIILGRIKEED